MSALQAPIVVVIPGDLHLDDEGLEAERVARWVIEEVNGAIRPDFVQFIGDNVQDATEEQFRRFDAIRGALKVPHFALVGDHDVKDDPDAGGFRRHVGKPWGSVSLGGFRFVRLNTQDARPLGLSPGQVDWFREEVDTALACGERVVVFQHNYPYQIWEDFAGPGIDDWRAIVQTRRVEAIVCGHTHYLQVANDGRNVCVATRSIGDPEGGPPGYLLVYLRGDDLALAHRPVDDPAPALLITHPRERLLATGPRHVVRGADRVVVRAWPWPGVSGVRCRIDGAPWSGLEPEGDGHWTGPLDGAHLAKGEHTAEAVATGHDGVEGRHEIAFMVDPTGRYTAVPTARPTVTGTEFC